MSLSNSTDFQEFIESSLPLLTNPQPLTRKIALDKIQSKLSNFNGNKEGIQSYLKYLLLTLLFSIFFINKDLSHICKAAFLQLVTCDNWITKQSGFNLATV